MFKYPLADSVYKENNTYIGLTTSTLSRRLMRNLYNSNSIALHFKTHSIPKFEFRKILVEKTNSIPKFEFRKILVEKTTIIAHETNKLQRRNLEALHIKRKKTLNQ